MATLTKWFKCITLLAVGAALLAPIHRAECATDKPLIDIGAPGAESRFTPAGGSNGQVTAAKSDDPAAPGVVIKIAPGTAGWPAAVLKPADGAASWDLSTFSHIDVHMTNVSPTRVFATVRIDNAGNWQDNPWNAEMADLQPGHSATVRVAFGRSYGHKPGFKLNPSAVTQVMIMTGKTDVTESIRVDSVVAGSDPSDTAPVPAPIAPPVEVRVIPAGGVILGPQTSFDQATQITKSAAVVNYNPTTKYLEAAATTQPSGNSLSVKPVRGFWDLTDSTQVRVKIANLGSSPVTPSVQLYSKEGPSDQVVASAPIAAGATSEIVVPFAPATTYVGVFNTDTNSSHPLEGTGTKFVSDAVSRIAIGLGQTPDAKLAIQAITAEAPAVVLPAWVGRRPPVEGNWVKTLDQSFTGPAIDRTVWNIAGINPWDKATHFSKDNLILGHGSVTLHFEKRTGYQNDDPAQSLLQNASSPHSTDYVCGYLDTCQHWKQRYGYFEAKLKLPTAPGLWPAFWMMPDGWDTGHNGMEFDIMEHLDRWGPHRYNIAMHWDGYGQAHKALGDGHIYAQHDSQGYMTVGLLWTPGSAIYYCNGKEVARWENPRVSSVASFFIIEMTTGGWDNNPVEDSKLPADFTIAYVRAWQRADLASPVDTASAPAQ